MTVSILISVVRSVAGCVVGGAERQRSGLPPCDAPSSNVSVIQRAHTPCRRPAGRPVFSQHIIARLEKRVQYRTRSVEAELFAFRGKITLFPPNVPRAAAQIMHLCVDQQVLIISLANWAQVNY